MKLTLRILKASHVIGHNYIENKTKILNIDVSSNWRKDLYGVYILCTHMALGNFMR